MKKTIISIFIILNLIPSLLKSEEGMWPPVFLGQRISAMQKLGLKLGAEDIYNINNSSLKDAIVQFGGGCTGVLVSETGLLLTNHHCGFGSIQKQSSIEHDYLTHGFWAGSIAEELPNPGLTVTFLIRMEDVSNNVLENVTPAMNEQDRYTVIKKNIDKIEKEAVKSTGFEAKVKPFYYGNQYFLFINEVFKDVRLVGAPPFDIGSFGGDTDNWAWPRHTGDFSVFRIYSSKDNKPAEYSRENVPYIPKKYLSVSLKGVEKGDFTLIFGFPGTTREYLTSYGVDLIAFKENPVKVAFRQKRLDIIEAAMAADRGTRIQYASKRAGIANGWKKMMGESQGIKRLNTLETKHVQEKGFTVWVNADQERVKKYGGLFQTAESTYQRWYPYDLAGIYITEGFQGIELLKFAGGFKDLVKQSAQKDVKEADLVKSAEKLKAATRIFFKDYRQIVDEQVALSILDKISKEMDPSFKPAYFILIEKKQKGDWEEFVNRLYATSVFADSSKILKILLDPRAKTLKKLGNDPAFLMVASATAILDKKVSHEMLECNRVIDSLQRIYIEGLMLYRAGKQLYPDANSTLRIAYGKVDDYSPADAINYRYFTTVKGILQKENPDIYDYIVEPKLKDLIVGREFGQYADKDGTMHVAFTASNHTSGGNSGSPVLDGNGRLIGLNFDRNWEGTMSDLQYDPDECRNIVLDIRYCLFIIDRFAGAQRLIDEMRLVKE
ncbi:MAG: S46 family peptidase [Bacteroidetes bacterium]|nr:S46 family peptidase [Bacteroidota bacterium]